MNVLIDTLRQYQWVYNNGETVTRFAYEKEPADAIVAELQRQLAEREAELAALVHPFDLEKYRSGK